MLPNQPEGWLYQGTSLAELKRHAEAREVLLLEFKRFNDNEIFPYDLACVCCALDRVEEAWDWIQQAIGLTGKPLRQRALEDEDLRPLHHRLRRNSKESQASE